MELTVWGLIFIPLSFILLLISPKSLISLLIFSLSLQRTTVINLPFSGYGLQLYRFLTILVTIYVVIKILYNGGRIKIQDVYLKRLFIILFAFLSYVIFISILGPIIFNGYPVFPPLLGIDYSAIYGLSPLEFSSLNIAMPLYILFYSAVFLYLLTLHLEEKDIKLILATWKITIFLTIFLLIFQLIFSFLGNENILAYVNNAPQSDHSLDTFSYSGYVFARLQGTFYEPSMASPFLVGIFMYEFASGRKTIANILGLVIIASLLLLTTSATAYMSILIMLFVYLFLNFPVRLKGHQLFLQKSTLKILASTLFSIIVTFLIIVSILRLDTIIYIISTFILEKPKTGSFYSRTTADIHSLKLFLNTYLMGVGIGSHRGSSLITNLLGTTGIVGTVLFLLFIVKFIKYSYDILKKTNYFSCFYLVLSAVISMSIAIPDLTLPTFWQFLYITIIVLQMVKYDENKKYETTLS